MKKIMFLTIFMILTLNIFAKQSKKISGKVLEETNSKPLIDAVVILEGTINFAYVNPKDGTFVLNLTEEGDFIFVYSPGYESKRLKLDKNINYYTISLKTMSKTISSDSVKISNDLVGDIKVDGAFLTEDRTLKEVSSLKGGFASKVLASESGGDGFISRMAMPSDADSPLMPYDGPKKQESSGLLTAGEVNDFSKWNMWNDLSQSELTEYKDLWKFYPYERISLVLENEFRNPVYGAKVNLLQNGYVIWSSVSDNTGKSELWSDPFTNKKPSSKSLSIEIEYDEKYYYIDQPKMFYDGINFYTINTGCLKPKFVDIAFVVDATGSMGDEINYLKLDIQDIMKQINDTLPNMEFNLGSVFYRDTTDLYLTKYSDFNSDVSVTSKFIADNGADGGGDFPEAVHTGLNVAINKLTWRNDAVAKIIFLVLDAPPHNRPEVVSELQALTLKAAEKGIRIIPVACSGIDKSTEYILRSIALLTNGTYTFLTDDSGIGNPHIKPSTDKYKVETLKELLIRIVYQYAYYPECHTNYPELVNDTLSVSIADKGNPDNNIEESRALNIFRYFPNPTFGMIHIQLDGNAKELFIADISGKIIYRIEPNGKTEFDIDLSSYPNGVYYLMYEYQKDKFIKGKIILIH